MIDRSYGGVTEIQGSFLDRELDVQVSGFILGSICAERTLRLDTGKLCVNCEEGDRVQSRQAWV